MDQAIETVTLFVLIATIVACAKENIIGVLQSEGREDDIMLAVSILICVVFNITLIEDIASAELLEAGEATTTLQVYAAKIRPWLDHLISGSALAGGGAKLIGRLRKAKGGVEGATA